MASNRPNIKQLVGNIAASPATLRIACHHCPSVSIAKDAVQYATLVTLEKPVSFLYDLRDTEKIEPYLYRIIYISCTRTSSPFYKKNIQPDRTLMMSNIDQTKADDDDCGYDYESVMDILLDMEDEEKENGKFPVDIAIFKMYVDNNLNALEVSRKLGVPKQVVYISLENIRKKVKERYSYD